MASQNAIGSDKPIQVAFGGTGDATLTDHGVLVGSGTGAVTPLAVGTDGQVLLGSTGADPVFATLTSTNGSITYTPGAGSLNIEIANYVATTFTPVLTFGGGSTGITYSTQTGLYTRFGNMVFIDVAIVLTNKGSSTGTALVTGLPVAANATPSVFASRQTNITYTGQFVVRTTASDTTCAIESQASAGAGATLTDAAFANNSTFRFTGVYFT